MIPDTGLLHAVFAVTLRVLPSQGMLAVGKDTRYALVDAAYAPFLQRYFFLDRIRKRVTDAAAVFEQVTRTKDQLRQALAAAPPAAAAQRPGTARSR